MACDHPLVAWKAFDKAENRPVMVFQRNKATNPDNPLNLPCGQCMGCRLDRAAEWADRAQHEAQLYDDNCIVTLTYEDKFLPADGSVAKKTVSVFVRAVRDANRDHTIRFMGCGEYGDYFGRPHYHVVLFNHTFADRSHWSTGPTGAKQWTSPFLTKHWPYGLACFSDFTRDGAAYVARYVTKKITGERAADHYIQPHPVTGVLGRIAPEFLLTSRRPGLGFGWLEKFYDDVYPSGHIMRNGAPARIPRYYDKKIREEHLKKLKIQRRLAGAKRKEDRTPEKRKARALIRAAKMSLIKR